MSFGSVSSFPGGVHRQVLCAGQLCRLKNIFVIAIQLCLSGQWDQLDYLLQGAMADDTLALFKQMRANNELQIDHSDHPETPDHDHASHASHPNHDEHLDKFEAFIRDHQRAYGTKDEIAKRFQIFERNLQLAEKLNNSERGSATYGINQFSDLTREEMKSHMGLKLQKD